MTSVPGWAFSLFALLGFWSVVFVLAWIVGTITGKLTREARDKGKRIELASVAIGTLALIVSIAALGYTMLQVDSLSDRVSALEKQLKGTPATTK